MLSEPREQLHLADKCIFLDDVGGMVSELICRSCNTDVWSASQAFGRAAQDLDPLGRDSACSITGLMR